VRKGCERGRGQGKNKTTPQRPGPSRIRRGSVRGLILRTRGRKTDIGIVGGTRKRKPAMMVFLWPANEAVGARCGEKGGATSQMGTKCRERGGSVKNLIGTFSIFPPQATEGKK